MTGTQKNMLSNFYQAHNVIDSAGNLHKTLNPNLLRNLIKKVSFRISSKSAQFMAGVNDDLGIYIKIPKTKRETQEVFTEWGIGKAPQWTHDGKINGTKIYYNKLVGSEAVMGINQLKNASVLFEDGSDNAFIKKTNIAFIQKRMDKTLGQALKDHYQSGDISEIKNIVNQLINKTKNELWCRNVYEITHSFSVNWGVDYLKKGLDVRLFDIWEITDNKEEAVERLGEFISNNYFEKSWKIMADWHPLSIKNFTDAETARWVLKRIKEEFTVKNLIEHWK